MKKPTFKRILAFIIDLLIISIISSALSNIKLINPTFDKYEESYNEYMNYLNNKLDVTSSSEILNSEEYQNLSYNLTYTGRYSNIITLVVSFLYFVVFQYYTKGFTGGKKLLKIQVKAKKGKLKFYQLLLRSLVINSLLTTSLSTIALFVLKQSTFNQASLYIELLEMGLLFVSFGMMLYKEDGRGLHDLIANTKVVSIKQEEE